MSIAVAGDDEGRKLDGSAMHLEGNGDQASDHAWVDLRSVPEERTR